MEWDCQTAEQKKLDARKYRNRYDCKGIVIVIARSPWLGMNETKCCFEDHSMPLVFHWNCPLSPKHWQYLKPGASACCRHRLGYYRLPGCDGKAERRFPIFQMETSATP